MHAQKAHKLLAAKQYDEALAEAQQAITLAPENAAINETLGHARAAVGRRDEAKAAYEKALRIANTVEPEFQLGTAASAREKLAKL